MWCACADRGLFMKSSFAISRLLDLREQLVHLAFAARQSLSGIAWVNKG